MGTNEWFYRPSIPMNQGAHQFNPSKEVNSPLGQNLQLPLGKAVTGRPPKSKTKGQKNRGD